tara:strand:- start:461 stop:1606 length:1146 start_codon:yes stop_codon:yes gene_type:complete
MRIEKRKISDLIKAEYNPRKISVVQLQELKDGIEEFGLVSPLVVNENPERKNIIVGGHQRLKIWEELGNKEVDCSIVNLELDKERKLNIKLNKNGGTFDDDLLKEFFDYEELIDWGFTAGELFDQDEKTEGLIDDDEIPEVKESIVVRGDIWKLGEHRVMCGDSTSSDDIEKLMNGEKADMVFTDPPYGVNYQSNMRTKTEKFNVLKNDNIFITEWIQNLPLYSNGFVFIWTSWKVLKQWIEFCDPIGDLSNIIIWNKGGGGIGDLKKTFSTDFEVALVYHRGAEIKGKRIGSVWSVGKDSSSSYLHPTQKPVELSVMAIENITEKNQIILDLFLGSGSTLIGAEKLGRKCYGMELDEKYCDVIIERWEQFTGLKAEKING